MAPQEPLFGAALIARFMAAVAQQRPRSGEFESRRVRVNGQPGRLLRGPAERPFGEAERLAVEEALALMRSDVDAKQLAALVKDARAATGGPTSPAAGGQQAEARVWSVLTVDVVEGRIQAVRIVRNPDKLGHLRAVTGRPAALSDLRTANQTRRILMASVAAQPFSGTYRAQPVVSSFAFAVRHSGVFWYRGSLSDVAGTLRGGGDALVLEGSARVDSISVAEPAAMRASVLGPEFFDAEHHPEITFRSTAVRLADDGRAEVDGELTIRGVTRRVSGSGRYAPPRPSSFGEIAGLELHTSFDRREFGFEWQMELPGGGDAVGWDVELDIDLLLMREDAEAGG